MRVRTHVQIYPDSLTLSLSHTHTHTHTHTHIYIYIYVYIYIYIIPFVLHKLLLLLISDTSDYQAVKIVKSFSWPHTHSHTYIHTHIHTLNIYCYI